MDCYMAMDMTRHGAETFEGEEGGRGGGGGTP